MSGGIHLIPRANWDYGPLDLCRAYKGIFTTPSPERRVYEVFRNIFGEEPILTTAGRTSLYAILKSLNLAPGSRVGVPLFCCDVVFDSIRQAGFLPRFLDIEPSGYNLSASDLRKKRGDLAAVIVVHMFGHPANMDEIKGVAADIPVIEDCAHSLMSKYKGTYTGLLSTASFFSFRSGKYVSAGEGSAVFTKDPSLKESIRKFVGTLKLRKISGEFLHCTATYVKSALYHRPWYGLVGFPIGRKLDQKMNLSAKTGFDLIGIAKSDLEIIDDRLGDFALKIEKQRQNSLYLLENVRLKDVRMRMEEDGCFSNFYQFPVKFLNKAKRDSAADHLFQRGIDVGRYLDEIANMARNIYGYEGDCPNAEDCSKTTLTIPNYYTLSANDLGHIAHALNECNDL